MAKKYITSCQHNSGADANLNCFDNIEDAVNEIQYVHVETKKLNTYFIKK